MKFGDQGIYFAVQGNILESDDVVLDAVAAFLAEEGTVVDRVMAGMEAADRAGGDARCSCRTQPVPETEARCQHRTAHVAYVAAAKPEDAIGTGHSDGSYTLFIDVDDENTRPEEDASPGRHAEDALRRVEGRRRFGRARPGGALAGRRLGPEPPRVTDAGPPGTGGGPSRHSVNHNPTLVRS